MRKHPAIPLLAVCVLLSGCMHVQIQRRSNVMSYLYPDATSAPAPAPGTARLQLPLRIGIAFVPADPTVTRGGRLMVREVLPIDAEKRLVDIVRKSFEGREWVSMIKMIPSNYLVQRGGFSNLDQVARLMDVDVVALVSVDQLQTSDPRRTSFLYLSIIGAYTLPLDRNETRTLIDAAVFHVPSRTFLLRAPGVSSTAGSSTAVDVESTLRERSYRGFELAMADLSKNLNGEVDSFKESVKSGARSDVDIVTKEGKSVRQGGNFGVTEALLAAAIVVAAAIRRRR